MLGSVLGSRKNVVTVSLSQCRAVNRGSIGWGRGARMAIRWQRVLARYG